MKRIGLALAAVIAVGAGAFWFESSVNAPEGSAPAGSIAGGYRLLWTADLSANADSTPVSGTITVNGSKRQALFVLAGNNTSDCDPGNPVKQATTYALDVKTGRRLWKQATKGRARCTTAAPIISGEWVYTVGLDGHIHKYAAATGKEYTGHGWPEWFTRMPNVEKESANLVVSGAFLYATTSGFIGDGGHYEGHLVTIDLSSGHRTVFNSLCSNIHFLLTKKVGSKTYCRFIQAGMFGRGQAVVDPVNHDVYVVTGNGPWNGSTNWGDSVLKLTPDGSRLVDAFTPKDQAYLNNSDNDLGSTGPAILPPVFVRGKTYHLLVQGGKGPATPSGGSRVLWLVNRDRMGSAPGPGHPGGQLQHVNSPGGCEVLTAPAVWTDSSGNVHVVYGNDCALQSYAIRISGVKKPRLVPGWELNGSFTTPVVSGNRIFVADSGKVNEYGTSNGKLITSFGSIGSVHWEYPAVSGKTVYMTNEAGKLFAFKSAE